MYEEESDTGPKGTFEIYKAEADTLFKQGEYRKAIHSYTTALELQTGEKNCLVSRSKCHLKLGDTENALIDAESSLADDKTYHRGLFQKAEALYYKGDFELALVFYHRGDKLRSELHEFRLGIQKTQEAIDNSVGSPDKVRLTTEGDLTFFQKQDEKKQKKKPFGSYAKTQPKLQAKPKRDTRKSTGQEKTVKQLLGELYGDKQYLEKLIKETDPNSEVGKTIYDLVEEGLSYLDTRTEFWRQQKPMYARKHEKLQQKRRQLFGSKMSPDDYIIRELEKIDQAQAEGRYSDSLKRSKKCLSTVENYPDSLVTNKLEVTANIHSCIGNAYLELNKYQLAEEHHLKDLAIGEKHNLEDAISRGLDNLGRVYARNANFKKAIDVWEQKLPLSKSSLESTWLYHEVGRCYLELSQFSEARSHGQKSLKAAEDAQDNQWQLQAAVLVAQSEVKLRDFSSAIGSFDKALDLAGLLGDENAEAAIKRAIDGVNAKILEDRKDSETDTLAEQISDKVTV